MPEFGTLESVDVREAWEDETRNFTPWLSANLERLSEVIGIPLELEGSEVRVEQFSADILARNSIDGSAVLIENQLEPTDHRHLGQILTYLAGLEAQTVIWVARDFQEAHLSAIRWLNEHTSDPFAFFAVRVGVVRIGDSPMTPIFEVIERPSGWDRRIRDVSQEGLGLTERGQWRREFWSYYADRHPDDGVRSGHAGNSVRHNVEDANLTIALSLGDRFVGVCFVGRWGEPAEKALERMKNYEDAIRDELGIELGDGPYWCYQYLSADSRNPENWLQMAEWLHEKLYTYREALTEAVAGQST